MKRKAAIATVALALCGGAQAQSNEELKAINLRISERVNAGKAKQYYPQLPVTRQSLIRQRCLANGVSLD